MVVMMTTAIARAASGRKVGRLLLVAPVRDPLGEHPRALVGAELEHA